MPIRRLFGWGSDPLDPADAAGGVAIGRTPADARTAALGSALGASIGHAPAFERHAAASGMDLRQLWSAQGPGGAVVAAALVIPHPGRTGLLMSTAPRNPEQARTVGRTIRHALADLWSEGRIQLVQALSSPGETLREDSLREGGLRHLATLDYLERPIAAPRGALASATLPPGIRVESWDPTDRGGMIDLLRRTYVGTLDCPGLSELRTGEDILDGHLHSGEFDPRLWLVLREGVGSLGALLLSPSPGTDSVEVVYLGLVPEARRRGLAAALLAHGMRAVADRHERTLALAVDARNGPAATLYARAGFASVRRREAWIAVPGMAGEWEPAGRAVK